MMINAEQIVRQSIALFLQDPPDSAFQEGYLSALLVFANEIVGIPWSDELLVLAADVLAPVDGVGGFIAQHQPHLTVIDGGKA